MCTLFAIIELERDLAYSDDTNICRCQETRCFSEITHTDIRRYTV